MNLPLKNILSAIADEINMATIRADINRSHWQKIYGDNDLLAEMAPSKIRIRECNLSIPLAMENISEAKNRNPELTLNQLLQVLPKKYSDEVRHKYASALRDTLLKNKTYLLSPKIKKEILRILSSIDPEIRSEDVNIAIVDKLKREYLLRPNQEREASFVYRAEELEKIHPDLLIRVEVAIEVD